ncbi:hypothetical protein [Streptomyces caatingaensis]|uniref:Uncharacterized protein n=1 Tax=Streptomyces caatingaensis TaxID=1678637 RepID=A0A0K9XGW6_9ACTN|nr:hypothetical protein [Streptomyces caatingaensis]KNB52301.1 hypothetical protein AC230_12190 [Streptomyces caatingaensis]
MDETGTPRREQGTWWSRWPVWSAWPAALWSLLYGAAGVYWAAGGGGYPFAQVAEERASASLLEPSRAAVAGPVIAAVGAAGAVAGVLMALGRGRGRRRTALLAFAWANAVTLALVLPDYSLLGLLAFSPLLVVFAFTGVPGPQDGIGDILYWHRGNLIILFVGGLLWGAAALAYQRRTRGVCAHCGRGRHAAARWATPEAARRWGRWAVWTAVLSSVPYDVTRLAWYAGWPLGITREFLDDMRSTPYMLEIGLGLGVLSTAGGLLTHGLVGRWGEVWPRWVLRKAGRRVHPATAIVPASVVALVLVPGGLMNLRHMDWELWATNGPGVFWALWGVALGAATLAYYLRRRGRCVRCGRG